MTNAKLKIAIFVLIVGIIAISGWWIWSNFETFEIKEKDVAIVTPVTKSGNYISISRSEKDDENVLLFDVNVQEYLVESADLSKLSEENASKYEKLGSEYIVPLEFNYTQGIPLLKIKTGSDSLECKPTIPYLEIEIILPPDSEVKGELLDFVEDKMEEKIEIMPLTTCSSYGCSDCPNYTKENDFFPSDISIRADARSFQEKTLARIYLPLSRHNPATRETYTIKEAKIKVIYKLSKNSMLLLEEKDIPNKVDTTKFNVSYKITNPSITDFNNLKIKMDLDDGAIINFSEEFNVGGYESKVISFQVDSLWYQGNFISKSYIIKDSEIVATMPEKRIQFSSEVAKPEMCKPSNAVHLTYQNIEEKINSGWWLVYTWTEDSYSCKLAPTVENLSREISKVNLGEIGYEKINLSNIEHYEKYNFSVFPALVLFKDGQEVSRKRGVHSKEDLKVWLESEVK